MRISKRTQYGLRAMVYLANPCLKNKICPLKKISRDEKIPFSFLEKIFSKLEKANLVGAKKGVQGGYFLTKSPKKIKIGEIVKILEGEISPVLCIISEKGKRIFCPRWKKCLTKSLWQKIHNVLDSTLNSITLADLIK